MHNDGDRSIEQKGDVESCELKTTAGVEHCSKDVSSSLSGDQKLGSSIVVLQTRQESGVEIPPIISIAITQPEEILKPKLNISKSPASEGDEKVGSVTTKKGFLSGSDSHLDQCRICQQQTEELLLDLGCRCRGELSKAHKSCIELWFRTKGSNKCEICQQVAANIPLPETQPSTSYWVWRIDSAYSRNARNRERQRCFSPLWVAFSILVGGLLLDVLISVSLGVSALPVNIIIGVLIVLGLGTALRLAMDCCHEWGARRILRDTVSVNPGFHPAV